VSDTQLNGSPDQDVVGRMSSFLADDGDTDADEADDNQEVPEDADADVEGEDDPDDEDEGDDQEEDDDEEDPDEQPQSKRERTYTVKVNGEDSRVSLQELIKGYSRTSDYTRKAQEVASSRKAAETELTSLKQERQQYVYWANQMVAKLKAEAPAEPDWVKLQNEDPIEFTVQWTKRQMHQNKVAELEQQLHWSNERQRRDEAVARDQVIAEEAEKLSAAIPEWRDEEAARKGKAELIAFGRKAGFSDQELQGVVDHRTVLVLRKAMLYDKMLSGKPKLQNQQKIVPRQAPPSSAAPVRQGSYKQQMQRLSKTGSIKDAATLMSRLL
jgi:hypothetical protein